MTVRWTPSALRDLETLHAYIDADNPKAASGTVDRILRGAEALIRQPLLGRTGRVAGTRELIVAPFVIAYRQNKNGIDLLAIIHGARRWPEFF